MKIKKVELLFDIKLLIKIKNINYDKEKRFYIN